MAATDIFWPTPDWLASSGGKLSKNFWKVCRQMMAAKTGFGLNSVVAAISGGIKPAAYLAASLVPPDVAAADKSPRLPPHGEEVVVARP